MTARDAATTACHTSSLGLAVQAAAKAPPPIHRPKVGVVTALVHTVHKHCSFHGGCSQSAGFGTSWLRQTTLPAVFALRIIEVDVTHTQLPMYVQQRSRKTSPRRRSRATLCRAACPAWASRGT